MQEWIVAAKQEPDDIEELGGGVSMRRPGCG